MNSRKVRIPFFHSAGGPCLNSTATGGVHTPMAPSCPEPENSGPKNNIHPNESRLGSVRHP